MTAWKHKNQIDWKNMVPEIDKMPEGTNMVLLQPIPVKKFTMTLRLNWTHNREKVSSSMDLEKTFDAVGPINVDVS